MVIVTALAKWSLFCVFKYILSLKLQVSNIEMSVNENQSDLGKWFIHKEMKKYHQEKQKKGSSNEEKNTEVWTRSNT